MERWKAKVVVEREELREKIQKLVRYLYSEKTLALSHKHVKLLREQLATMTKYEEILTTRLETPHP